MCQEEGCVGLKPTDQRKATDYFATDVWHRSTGSFDYYIKRIQAKALADNAPLDALFKRDGKMDVCVGPRTRPSLPSDAEKSHCIMSTKSKPVWIQFATERQVQDLFPSQAKLTGVSSKGFEWTSPNWLIDLLENAQVRESNMNHNRYPTVDDTDDDID